jgi:HK97 family phage portal protein
MGKISNFIGNFSKILNKEISVKRNYQSKKATNQAENNKAVPFSIEASNDLPSYSPMGTSAYLQQYKSWVYSAVNKRSNEIAQIDLHLYKKLTSKGKETYKEIIDHPVLDLLDRVNKIQTFTDLIKLTQIYKDLCGEAFWWIVKNAKNEPIEIYPFLRPDLMQIATSATEFVTGYVYNAPGGEQIPFSADEIIHFKYPNPLDPYRGYSPIKAGEMSIATHNESSNWNWIFFKNQAKPHGIITFNTTITQDQIERIKTQWSQKHSGVENAFRIAVLGAGASYQDIGFSMKDMDFKELKTMSRDEILAIFQVPLSILNPNESINRATAQVAKDVFLEQTIMPLMTDLVNVLNEFLLPLYGDDSLIFDYSNKPPKDELVSLQKYQNGVANGWLTPNEIREEEGRDGYKGGDQFYIPFNISPIGSADRIKKYPLPKMKAKKSNKKINNELIKKIIIEKLSKNG